MIIKEKKIQLEQFAKAIRLDIIKTGYVWYHYK